MLPIDKDKKSSNAFVLLILLVLCGLNNITFAQSIKSNVDRFLKDNPGELTESQRNAIGEGLLFYYSSDPNQKKYQEIGDKFSSILSQLDYSQKAGERFLILATCFGVDPTVILDHSKPYEKDNLFFTILRLDYLGKAGLIIEARELAMKAECDRFSFSPSEGLQSLFELLKKNNVKEPAREIVTAKAHSSYLIFVQLNDFLYAISRLYDGVVCSQEDHFKLLCIKYKIVSSLLKQREVVNLAIYGHRAWRDLQLELKQNQPYDSKSQLASKYKKLLQEMDNLKSDIEFTKATYRKYFLYDFNNATEKDCEQIIRHGYFDYAKKLKD